MSTEGRGWTVGEATCCQPVRAGRWGSSSSPRRSSDAGARSWSPAPVRVPRACGRGSPAEGAEAQSRPHGSARPPPPSRGLWGSGQRTQTGADEPGASGSSPDRAILEAQSPALGDGQARDICHF